MTRRTGIVALLDILGDEVLTGIYNSPNDRHEILHKWRQRIGPTFYRMQVAIMPFEQTDLRTNRDGTNYNFATQLTYRKKRETKIELFLNGVSDGIYTSERSAYTRIAISWYTFQKLLSGNIKSVRGFTAQRVNSATLLR